MSLLPPGLRAVVCWLVCGALLSAGYYVPTGLSEGVFHAQPHVDSESSHPDPMEILELTDPFEEQTEDYEHHDFTAVINTPLVFIFRPSFFLVEHKYLFLRTIFKYAILPRAPPVPLFA